MAADYENLAGLIIIDDHDPDEGKVIDPTNGQTYPLLRSEGDFTAAKKEREALVLRVTPPLTPAETTRCKVLALLIEVYTKTKPSAEPPAFEQHPVLREAIADFKRSAAGDVMNPLVMRRLNRILKLLPTLEQVFAPSPEAEEAAMLARKPAWSSGGIHSYVSSNVFGGGVLSNGVSGSDDDDDDDDDLSLPGPMRNQPDNPVETFQSRLMREGIALATRLTEATAKQAAAQLARVHLDAITEERLCHMNSLPDMATEARTLRETLADDGHEDHDDADPAHLAPVPPGTDTGALGFGLPVTPDTGESEGVIDETAHLGPQDHGVSMGVV